MNTEHCSKSPKIIGHSFSCSNGEQFLIAEPRVNDSIFFFFFSTGTHLTDDVSITIQFRRNVVWLCIKSHNKNRCNMLYRAWRIGHGSMCKSHFDLMTRTWIKQNKISSSYPPRNEVGGGGGGGGGGGYWIHLVCLSVCPSVCLSVCLLTFRVRPVASTVHGFFPYLVQMINSMRGCVACDDLWPWPISSRSFGLDLENHVRSVASTVLDGFFLYLAQMITIMKGCVACHVFIRIRKFDH